MGGIDRPQTVWEWKQYLSRAFGGHPDDVVIVNDEEPGSVIVAVPPWWGVFAVEEVIEDIRPVNLLVKVVEDPLQQ